VPILCGKIRDTVEDCSGHQTTSRTVDIVERVNILVEEDRLITVTDTADKLDISCGIAYFIIREDSRYHKICLR
jgi:ribosomal protein S25